MVIYLLNMCLIGWIETNGYNLKWCESWVILKATNALRREKLYRHTYILDFCKCAWQFLIWWNLLAYLIHLHGQDLFSWDTFGGKIGSVSLDIFLTFVAIISAYLHHCNILTDVYQPFIFLQQIIFQSSFSYALVVFHASPFIMAFPVLLISISRSIIL